MPGADLPASSAQLGHQAVPFSLLEHPKQRLHPTTLMLTKHCEVEACQILPNIFWVTVCLPYPLNWFRKWQKLFTMVSKQVLTNKNTKKKQVFRNGRWTAWNRLLHGWNWMLHAWNWMFRNFIFFRNPTKPYKTIRKHGFEAYFETNCFRRHFLSNAKLRKHSLLHTIEIGKIS